MSGQKEPRSVGSHSKGQGLGDPGCFLGSTPTSSWSQSEDGVRLDRAAPSTVGPQVLSIILTLQELLVLLPLPGLQPSFFFQALADPTQTSPRGLPNTQLLTL